MEKGKFTTTVAFTYLKDIIHKIKNRSYNTCNSTDMLSCTSNKSDLTRVIKPELLNTLTHSLQCVRTWAPKQNTLMHQ